jgi:CheY-like chemotaxis protein
MKKVLLAEDDMILAMVMQRTLQRLGYEVVEHCTNADSAIKSAAELQPDVLLMDIRLEGSMDGIEAVQAIQSTSKQRIPAIYLTGSSDPYHRDKAQGTDYIEILVKPIQERKLKTALDKLNVVRPN